MAVFYESLMPVPVHQLAGFLAEGAKAGWKHELTAYVGIMQPPTSIAVPAQPSQVPVYVMIFSFFQEDCIVDPPEQLSKIVNREFEKQRKAAAGILPSRKKE
jgi:hypothetical protein